MIQRVNDGNSKAALSHNRRWTCFQSRGKKGKKWRSLVGAVYRLNFLQANIWHRLGYSNAPLLPSPPSTAEKILFFVVVNAGSQASLTARQNVSPSFVLFQNCSPSQLCLLKNYQDFQQFWNLFTSIDIFQRFSFFIFNIKWRLETANMCRRQHMFQTPCQLSSPSK